MNFKDLVIIILLILLLILGITSCVYYYKYNKADGEVILINDSLTVYKNKYDEEYTAKNTYILKAEQLEQYNKELYKEYKSLKDNPVVIIKPQLVYKIDTVYAQTDTIQKADGFVTWQWSAQDSTFYRINGESKISYDYTDAKTAINEMLIDAGLTIDIVDDGDNLKVLARSSNPYITIPEMSSVIIDPTKSPTLSKKFKQKRWGIGPYFGVGISGGYGYCGPGNPMGATFNVGASAGICVSYHLFEW